MRGGIGDILFDEKTGYILSGKLDEDISKIEEVLSQRQYQQILENARKYVVKNFDQEKQISILIRSFSIYL